MRLAARFDYDERSRAKPIKPILIAYWKAPALDSTEVICLLRSKCASGTSDGGTCWGITAGEETKYRRAVVIMDVEKLADELIRLRAGSHSLGLIYEFMARVYNNTNEARADFVRFLSGEMPIRLIELSALAVGGAPAIGVAEVTGLTETNGQDREQERLFEPIP
jgi:hypothetical protein